MLRFGLWTLLALMASPCFALVGEVVNYVKQYQIGVDYSNSVDYLSVSYETEAAEGSPKSCTTLTNSTSKRCTFGMVAGSSSGWGIFLQRAFKQQGFWYFDYDLGFGARYLTGEIDPNDKNNQGTPLRDAKFSLGTLIVKPYIQFGVTPSYWPDLLISLGPAAQVAFGSVTINDHRENVIVGTSSYSGPLSVWQGFLEVEIVLKRFGDGAFSLFAAHDYTGNGDGSKIYPKDVDGMSNFRGSFSHRVGGSAMGFGLKLVTPWP